MYGSPPLPIPSYKQHAQKQSKKPTVAQWRCQTAWIPSSQTHHSVYRTHSCKKDKEKKKNIKLSAVDSLALYVNNVSLFKQQGITKKGIYCQSQRAGEPLLKGTAQAALVVCVTKKLNHLLIRHQINHLTSHVSRSPCRKSADMLF